VDATARVQSEGCDSTPSHADTPSAHTVQHIHIGWLSASGMSLRIFIIPFIVHHSSFIIHRSSFIVHHSSFIIHRSSLSTTR